MLKLKTLSILIGILGATLFSGLANAVSCPDILSSAQKQEIQAWLAKLPEAKYGAIGGRISTTYLPIGRIALVRVTDMALGQMKEWMSSSPWNDGLLDQYLSETERQTFNLWLARLGSRRRSIEYTIIHSSFGPIMSAKVLDTGEKITFTDFTNW